MRRMAVDLRMRWVRAAMVWWHACSGRRLLVARHGHCLRRKGASRDGMSTRYMTAGRDRQHAEERW